MKCSENAFCASLSDELRGKLCECCFRRLMKAGSVQIYADFERRASLLIDGAVLISGHVGEDVMGYSDEIPTCYLGVPGRVLSTNVTFREGGGTEQYGYNAMEYLTDCCVAYFDHEVIRRLFAHDADFARAVLLSELRVMEDGCMMTAILRAESVYLSVYHLIRYLTQHRVYLAHRQIADLLGRDRTSVSKAMSRIKSEQSGVWEAYVSNKNVRRLRRGRVLCLTLP